MISKRHEGRQKFLGEVRELREIYQEKGGQDQATADQWLQLLIKQLKQMEQHILSYRDSRDLARLRRLFKQDLLAVATVACAAAEQWEEEQKLMELPKEANSKGGETNEEGDKRG